VLSRERRGTGERVLAARWGKRGIHGDRPEGAGGDTRGDTRGETPGPAGEAMERDGQGEVTCREQGVSNPRATRDQRSRLYRKVGIGELRKIAQNLRLGLYFLGDLGMT
jgi:hypothetical protein